MLVSTMETLLIGGLEPPQNRRRGDGFNATEFIQTTDTEVELCRATQFLLDLKNSKQSKVWAFRSALPRQFPEKVSANPAGFD
ncbi:hypothetical protein [Cutibacterium granulosum]|uniref:hypothetical protein n=1 Tax=Cutibacterium granulosum TaxID=33011 RepID=UPI0027BAF499|nr:hypothetical protein [Cutibacterium granulosum]